jgi:hypothetical protein
MNNERDRRSRAIEILSTPKITRIAHGFRAPIPLETPMTSETQLDNQHVRWIEVLGFILSPYKPASTKDRTSIVLGSDSHQTI